MADSVDITGVDKRALLRALWENSAPASFFAHSGVPPPAWDDKKVPDPLTHVDYHQGRCIKVDFSGSTINPAMYDRDMGQGSVARIVAALKE